MFIVSEILIYVVWGIKMFSIIVLLAGLVLCLKNLLTLAFKKEKDDESRVEIQKIKNNLGWFVLLGLEILIIGDIIDSILNPSFEDLARLAVIVLIRTVISYFLNKEIGETDAAIDKMKGNKP